MALRRAAARTAALMGRSLLAADASAAAATAVRPAAVTLLARNHAVSCVRGGEWMQWRPAAFGRFWPLLHCQLCQHASWSRLPP